MPGKGSKIAAAAGLAIAVGGIALWLAPGRRGAPPAPTPPPATGTAGEFHASGASGPAPDPDRSGAPPPGATGPLESSAPGTRAPDPAAFVAPVPAAGESWVPATVPARLHRLFGLGPGASYGAQMDAAASLPAALSDEDVAWLHAFLRWPGDGRSGPLRLDAVKNDISMALQRCVPRRADYVPLLLELHRDPAQGPVWRDYCLQHMGEWYPSATADERAALRAALVEAARTGRDGSFAGSALIALRRNAGTDDLAREAVRDESFAVLADPACGTLARITALQVCATLGDARALPQARALAAACDEATVRASAIAALGYLGTPDEDGELLRGLATSSDARLRVPAQGSLARMSGSRTPARQRAGSTP